MKRLVGIEKAFVALLSAWVMAGCGGDSGGTADAAIVVSSGTYYHYVTDTMDIGCKCSTTCNLTCADSYAFDLDGDSRHRPDNALGHVLIALQSSNGIQIQQAITTALNAGQFVILDSMRADSLTTDNSVSWQVFIGNPFQSPATPKFDGSGTFTVATASPADAKVLGGIAGGEFQGGPGYLTLKLTLVMGTESITVHLIHAMVQADCTDMTCTNGKIGGAILVKEINDTIIPAIAKQLDDRMVQDGCPTKPYPVTCTSQDQQILALFDACASAGTPDAGLGVCGNGRIEVDEVRYNAVVSAVLQPDMDLLDASGNPGTDGVKESISLGLGFTAVKGTFTAPGE